MTRAGDATGHQSAPQIRGSASIRLAATKSAASSVASHSRAELVRTRGLANEGSREDGRTAADSWSRFSNQRGNVSASVSERGSYSRGDSYWDSYGSSSGRDSYGSSYGRVILRSAIRTHRTHAVRSRRTRARSYPSYARGSYPSYSRPSSSQPSYSRGSYPSYSLAARSRRTPTEAAIPLLIRGGSGGGGGGSHGGGRPPH